MSEVSLGYKETFLKTTKQSTKQKTPKIHNVYILFLMGNSHIERKQHKHVTIIWLCRETLSKKKKQMRWHTSVIPAPTAELQRKLHHITPRHWSSTYITSVHTWPEKAPTLTGGHPTAPGKSGSSPQLHSCSWKRPLGKDGRKADGKTLRTSGFSTFLMIWPFNIAPFVAAS